MSTDSKINELLKKVELKKEKLQQQRKASKVAKITDGVLMFEGKALTIWAADEYILLRVYGYIEREIREQTSAMAALGYATEKKLPGTNNYPPEDFLTDIKTVFSEREAARTKKELDAMEKTLNSLMSAEAKALNEANRIEKLLGDM